MLWGLAAYPRARKGKAAAFIDRGEVGNQSRCAAVADGLRAAEPLRLLHSRATVGFLIVSVYLVSFSYHYSHPREGVATDNGLRFVHPSSHASRSQLPSHHRLRFTHTNTM